MTDTPPRKRQSVGVIIGVIVLVGFALAGLIETVVLITLAWAGKIG